MVESIAPDRKKAQIVKLFANANDDSKELFARLLSEAESGDLVGAVVIALRPRNKAGQFDLAISGLASTDPALAAGAFSACQVLIQELALQDAGLRLRPN